MVVDHIVVFVENGAILWDTILECHSTVNKSHRVSERHRRGDYVSFCSFGICSDSFLATVDEMETQVVD